MEEANKSLPAESAWVPRAMHLFHGTIVHSAL